VINWSLLLQGGAQLLYEPNPTGVVLIPKAPWTSQPKYPSRINWSHPATAQLVRAGAATSNRDLVTNALLTTSSIEPWEGGNLVARGGTTWPFSYATGDHWTVPTDGSLTILAAYPKTLPISFNGLGLWRSNSNSRGASAFYIEGLSVIVRVANVNVMYLTSGPFVPTRRLFYVAFRVSSGTSGEAAVFWNGIKAATVNHTQSLSGSTVYNIGAQYNSTDAIGHLAAYWVWNRSLSDAELVALTQNPWQLYQPQRFIFPAQTAGVTANNLLANDLQSSSSVSTPSLGQTHGLLANDLQSASSVSTPTLGQTHVLLANDLQSTSSVSTPSLAAFANVDTLLADNLESLSTLSTPALGQTHEILANDLQSASSLSTPTVGQVHVLLADNLQSASSLSTPSISQTHVLLADNLQSLSTLSTPSLGGTLLNALLANDLQSVSTLSIPVLRQKKQINYAASATVGSLSAITFYHNSGKWYGY